MNIHSTDPWAPRGGAETPESVALNRRRWLRRAGLAGAGLAALGGGWGAWTWLHPADEDVLGRGAVGGTGKSGEPRRPAFERDERFTYEREETSRVVAARHTNFYEFSRLKSTWRFVERFRPLPWTLTIDGLCRRPLRLDYDEFLRRYADDLVERQYRHRCVERWAMAVPWYGVPLARILRDVDPQGAATHVRFVSFRRPEEAGLQKSTVEKYPWPYCEGLTIGEAANELPLVAVGMYGQPLLKQHGAPLRLVVPWKYGYKSIKSIERIELINHEPATFWNALNPQAYPFESNVDPTVPRPWNQEKERMLGTDEEFATQPYNGYGEWVAKLYS